MTRVGSYLRHISRKARISQREYSEREKIKVALAQILENQIELLAHDETLHRGTKKRLERQTQEIRNTLI